MKPRWIAAGLSLLIGLPAVSGCETLRQSIRRSASDKDKTGDDGDRDKMESVDSEAPKSFFNPSRLSGAMSDEGRDIERSLGIH